MGFLTRKDLPAKTADAPTHSTFENIVISIVTHSSITPQVHVPLPFLMISCFSVVFCLLSLPNSSSVETSMSMWIQIVSKKISKSTRYL